jgi:Alw26I/Eco31I/Esp3I family type II restriction endonuclease
MPELFTTRTTTPPDLGEDLEAWLEWIEETLVPSESYLLSPGAMSNAPDRFDGFHSFNRCCRGEADTGRHSTNMKTYTTDRRVFEYWSEGNWIAADRMMGLVRTRFANHPNADGGKGPPSADHIGPLSLGFTHRPEFRLLSKSANSSKNNRMTLWDVSYLRAREAQGVAIVSWYAAPIWRALNPHVTDEETALRLSKIMRDNQRQAMRFLAVLRDQGHAAFLASLLELEYADLDVEFEGLAIEDYVTTYRALHSIARTTKYAAEQKSRRMRIGFEALRSYSTKTNRHFKTVHTEAIERRLRQAHQALSDGPAHILQLDREILSILDQPGTHTCEEALRGVCTRLPKVGDEPTFIDARSHLRTAMQDVAEKLALLWNDERYIRAEFAFDGD